MTSHLRYVINSPSQLRDLLIGYRKERQLTQAALAEMLGITQQSYAQIEANPAATSFERLYRIFRLLDVQIALSREAPARHAEQLPTHQVAQPVQRYAQGRADAPDRSPAHDQDDW